MHLAPYGSERNLIKFVIHLKKSEDKADVGIGNIGPAAPVLLPKFIQAGVHKNRQRKQREANGINLLKDDFR